MAMPTQYDINAVLHGVNAFGLPFSTQIFSADLTAATDISLDVPTISAIGAMNSTNESIYVAVFTYESDSEIWVALNETATIPAGGTFAASGSSLNPTARVVSSGDIIHMICTAGAVVSVEFYTIQVG